MRAFRNEGSEVDQASCYTVIHIIVYVSYNSELISHHNYSIPYLTTCDVCKYTCVMMVRT